MNHKKTYFMKTFNLISNLILFSILDFFVKFMLDFINTTFEKSNLHIDFIPTVSNFTFEIGIALVLVTTLLVAFEIINRIRYDSVSNYFKSGKQTISLHRFLQQSENSEKNTETQNLTSYNPINDQFNRFVRKSCIDVMDDKILVFFKVPRTQQAQRILKELGQQIKEELSSQNPEYIFSNPERYKNQLWIQGTRRK